LVLFSHGNASAKEQSVFFTEELARNGYVVMAIDHTGNSFFDDNQAILPIMNQLRPQDLTAAIDRLSAPQNGDPAWFATQIDFSRVAATGHSRGAYTALALAGAALTPSTAYRVYCASNPDEGTCEQYPPDAEFHTFRDERISAVVLFSPAKYTLRSAGIAQTQTPALLMTGMLDAITRYGMEVRPIYDALLTDKYLWTIEHGDHFTFSDLCEAYEVLPPERQVLFGVACDEDNPLPLAEAHNLIRPVAQTFLDVYLRGATDVDGLLEPSEGEEVRMETVTGP
jgi:predicted dienelactone hydrolase